jgi:hypothetical protein
MKERQMQPRNIRAIMHDETDRKILKNLTSRDDRDSADCGFEFQEFQSSDFDQSALRRKL